VTTAALASAIGPSTDVHGVHVQCRPKSLVSVQPKRRRRKHADRTV